VDKPVLETPFAPSVEKITISMPFGFYAAVPGNPEDGGGIAFDEITGTTAINTYEQAALGPSGKLALPNRLHSSGPIAAIMIAPDSPIDCCDLWFGAGSGTMQRHRIGVGAPLVGFPSDLGECVCTLPSPIPDPFDNNTEGDNAATWLGKNDVFDSVEGGGQTSIAPADSRAEMNTPLRLWALRGNAPQINHTKRAPYVADAYYTMTGAGIGYRRFWFVTQGRRSIDATVYNLGANPLLATVEAHSLTLKQKGGALTHREIQRNRTQHVMTAQAVASGAWFKRTYDERFALYSVRIDHGGAAVKAAIHLEARDD
jgi:hypothetical protein